MKENESQQIKEELINLYLEIKIRKQEEVIIIINLIIYYIILGRKYLKEKT